ncbi:GNAT family N-acetyltransferase [Aquicoccus sp. SCR17]|nr:GNAT family N-acetyltransferase [Carideicomes alvinocaridis]
MAQRITAEEQRGKGRYALVEDGRETGAELTYSRTGPELVIIDHTGVPEPMRGRGAGRQLVEHAVAEARREGWHILPLCPFAGALFRRNPDWADVLEGR